MKETAVAGVVGDINPKTMESAKRQFVELYGSALVMNTYLKIALVLVSLVALGLLGLRASRDQNHGEEDENGGRAGQA
jgi:hypothetical protein